MSPEEPVLFDDDFLSLEVPEKRVRVIDFFRLLRTGVLPSFVRREVFERRKSVQRLLGGEQESGEKSLFLAKDLNPWDIPAVNEALGGDNSCLQELSKRLQVLGGLLSAHMKEDAKNFYSLGEALETGRYEKTTDPSPHGDQALDDEKKEELLRWVLGGLGNGKNLPELEKKSLQLLACIQKADALCDKTGDGPDDESQMEASIHGTFLKKIDNALDAMLEGIWSEMFWTLLKKKKEMLVKEFLERNKSTALEGSVEMAQKTHQLIQSFPFENYATNPSNMINNSLAHTLLAHLLMEGILDHLGIVSVPVQSIGGKLMMIATSEKIFLMNPAKNNGWEELQAGDVFDSEGKVIPLEAVRAFMNDPKAEGLEITLAANAPVKKFLTQWCGEMPTITLYPRKEGSVILAMQTLSRAHMMAKGYEQALAHLRVLEILEPKNHHHAYSTASLLFQMENYDEALMRTERLARRKPDHEDIISLHAKILIHSGMPEKAEALLKAMFTKNPGSQGTENLLILCVVAQKKVDEAKMLYERYLQKYPEDEMGFIKYAWFYEQILHAPEEALRVLREGRKQHPKDVKTLVSMAHLERILTNCEASERLIQEAIALDAKWHEIYIVSGESFASQGKIREANDMLRKAAILCSGDKETAFHLAMLLVNLQLNSEAEDLLKKILKHNPYHAQARSSLAELYAMILQKPKKAEEIYKGLLRQNPHNHVHVSHLSLVLLQQGKTQEAIALLEEATQLHDQNPVIWTNLAGAYEFSNNPTKAIRALQKALECLFDENNVGLVPLIQKKLMELQLGFENPS